jgi:hypothetical protein
VTPSFRSFIINLMGKNFARYNEAVGYAGGSVAAGWVTKSRQVSAEKPDKKCHTTNGSGGPFRR